MSRNSFLIEDILSRTDKTSTPTDTSQPFKKRQFNASADCSESEHKTKMFKTDTSCISPASSSISCASSNDNELQNSNYYETNNSDAFNNDFLLSSILHGIQHSCDQHQQQQLLANYYSLMMSKLQHHQQQQQASTDIFQQHQLKSFLMSKLIMPQQHSSNIYSQINKTKPVKVLQNDKFLHKPKPANSISSSPASSSSSSSSSSTNETYNLNSNNLSPQSSSNDECSSLGMDNVSPLDALLQLANSTFVKTNANVDISSSSVNGHSSLLDKDSEINCFKKIIHNGVLADDRILYNNDLLLQQQQQQQLLEKKAKSSLNSSFESTSAAKSSPTILINNINNTSNTKRKRKNRTAFTANQIFELEKRFSNQRYLSPHDRDRIAYELSLSTAQVITWFQNRRAKQKRDIEEMKNDVTAAKNSKVLDPDLDVEKVLRVERFHDLTSKMSSGSDKNSMNENQDDYDDENNDLTNTSEDEYYDENKSGITSTNGDFNAADNSVTNEGSAN